MSGIYQWWQQKLRDRCPVAPAFRVPGYFKARDGAQEDDLWPGKVARVALYLDYQSWHEPWVKRMYDGKPGEPPPFAHEHVFFNTMVPILYIHGKEKMVRNYHVKEQKRHNGEWVTVLVRRYFVRLGTWQEHADAFKQVTGMDV